MSETGPQTTNGDDGAPTEKGRLERALDAVERAGNRLPDPVTLFLILIALVMVASLIAALAGLSTPHPLTGDPIRAKNLFSGEMLKRLFVEMPETFMGFAPLGVVLLAMLGVGLAEKSGFIGAGLTAFIRRVPERLLAPALVFAGVMSSLAVDVGYVVLVPLGGVLFLGAGRHPVAGIAAAFAGVSAGFSANLLITPLDGLLAGLSTEAARIVDSGYAVPVEANYYLMVTLVVVFTALGTWVTERIIEPRVGNFEGRADIAEDDDIAAEDNRRGLRYAGYAALAVLVLLVLLAGYETAPLRTPTGEAGSLLDSIQPLLQSLVGLLFLGFLVIGIAYGVGAGTIKNDRDAVQMSANAMSDMALYIVLAFVIAHFVALFNWSNLGLLSAIGGAQALKALDLPAPLLLVGVVLVAGVLNIFIGSASAKWGLFAPVFVPMLMLLGITPEATQAAYRMGDAFTNIITPLLPYFPLVIVFARRYDSRFGIGSLVAVMLPYSIVFGLGSTVTMLIWLLLDLPLGPGISATMPVPE